LRSLRRQITQLLTVTREQVECVEARLTATKEQVLELRISFSVQADYLAIEHGTFGVALQRESAVLVLERT
jgi:ribosomal protein L29